jgi:hypothetical protein
VGWFPITHKEAIFALPHGDHSNHLEVNKGSRDLRHFLALCWHYFASTAYRCVTSPKSNMSVVIFDLYSGRGARIIKWPINAATYLRSWRLSLGSLLYSTLTDIYIYYGHRLDKHCRDCSAPECYVNYWMKGYAKRIKENGSTNTSSVLVRAQRWS